MAKRVPPNFAFQVSAFVFLALLGLSACGTPGAPTPPRPVVPEAVTDLAARQNGRSVVLTFTLPKKSIEGDPLAEPPILEIYRAAVPDGSAPPTQDFRPPLYVSIPSALVDTFLSGGRVSYPDALPGDVAKNGQQLVYAVTTRASKRRNSDSSNMAVVRVYPPPDAVRSVDVTLTASAIELRWPAAAGSGAGAMVYRVYRADVAPGAEGEAVANPERARLLAPPALLATTPSTSFSDTQFEFGRTYFYTVRSVAAYDADSVESEDSAPRVVTARDTFPPAPPANVVAVLVPATPDARAQIELSWSISPEPDLAGYHVYRVESLVAGEGTRPQRISRELLIAPAFRDISVEPGKHYTYTVTAVDRAGNESAPSAAVTESVPAAPPQTDP